MASGELPLATYHRTSSLGEGTFGSVCVVYNNDGEEFALKLFYDSDDEDDGDEDDEEYESDDDEGEEEEEESDDEEEEGSDENDDDDEEEEGERYQNEPLDLGALREISILRLLRHQYAHPNIVAIHDVKPIECGEEDPDNVGAGTQGVLGMAMPVYHDGTLQTAIDSNVIRNKAVKVQIAHGLLSAVAFLHRNGILHRDIKADNCMLTRDADDETKVIPVLIDFSLAKVVNAAMYEGTPAPKLRFGDEAGTTHTASAGTPTYRAPEVIEQKPYGLKSDCWSVGVILLELLTGHTLTVEKDGQALRLVEDLKANLPDQPFANLVRGLLEVDPEKRLGAHAALESSPLFRKFGLEVGDATNRILDMSAAFDEEALLDGKGLSDSTNTNATGNSGKVGKNKADLKIARRQKQMDKICTELQCQHPLTKHAALTYATHMLELDEETFDGTKANPFSQALLDCALLAAKMFEEELPDLEELDERSIGMFKNWSVEEYADTETTVWMMMDFCLLPRRLVSWS